MGELLSPPSLPRKVKSEIEDLGCLLCGSAGKESACKCGKPGFDLWVGKIPRKRERLPAPVFWPGELSPWGCKERLSLFTSVSLYIRLWDSDKESTCQCRRHKRHRFHPWLGRSPGKGDGNQLQYSCLGNPMDLGASLTVKGICFVGYMVIFLSGIFKFYLFN